MKFNNSKKLQNILLNILETSRELNQCALSDELDLEQIRALTATRGTQMQEFGSEFVNLRDKADIPNQTIESFTNIYKQIVKNQHSLDDTINRRLTILKKQLVDIGRDKRKRSQYLSNSKQDFYRSSVLLTSKIQG
jgi:transcription termination factor NusB